MSLTMLAIIPSIVLLRYIYKMDKKEKEPKRLLLWCFILGILTAIPSTILESLEDAILINVADEGSFLYSVVDGFVVAALSEELFKYIFLKKKTWNSKFFDCMFDGIVYSVFVSLGFATFENIIYVLDGGFAIAIVRMFTSVPGHMCFAVYMGYFYSRSKLAEINNDLKSYKKNKKKSLYIPIVLHGIYDCLIMFEEDQVGEGFSTIALFMWIIFVIVLFSYTFELVKKSSANDAFILINPDGTKVLSSIRNAQKWICTCGMECRGNFCVRCGAKRI